MTDSRLSTETFVCSHRCCVVPNDPNHQHVFTAAECPLCHTLEAVQEGRSPWKT